MKFTKLPRWLGPAFLSLALALATASTALGATSAASIPVDSYAALHYRNIGPFVGGRSLAVSGNAATPHTFYAGYTGGGVWKTTDDGLNWTRLSSDQYGLGVVGSLEVAPSDPDVVYVGTGEGEIRGNMMTGNGVYKSTDAGKTWKHVGLEDTRVVARMTVDPHDPNRVFAAAMGHVFAPNAERGVYRTTDGGATWKKVLYVDDKTGAIDVVVDPGNPQVVYAAMWEAYRRPWELSSGGPGSGLYKSTDGGEHWTDISRNAGLPAGVLGKIGVAVSPADPNVVYAIIEAGKGGVYRSADAGKTWTFMYGEPNLTQRAWYYMHIFADPKDANTVYAPQVEGIFKSTDGGKSFKALRLPHGDVHGMWINPDDPDIMVSASDGGAAVSPNGGKSWSSILNQPTGQFYHVAVDDQFPYHVYGAQQDNSSRELASATADSGISLVDVWTGPAGESGWLVPVPGKPWISYGGGYGNSLARLDRRTQVQRSINAWPDNPMGHPAGGLKYRFQWTFPIVVSTHGRNAVYVGSQYVMRSRDEGMSWEVISPDLTRNLKKYQGSSGGPLTKDNTSVEYYGVVFALAESPVQQGVLWAGSDDGLVHVSTDDGAHWSNVTPQGLPELTTISLIDASPTDAGTAYVAARRYRLDDYRPYVYKTTDYGKTWTKITDGLPDDESSFVVRQDPQNKDLLFAGTFKGVYVSFDGGGSWQSLQLNLPAVPVQDMVIQRDGALVLATHGLSFWILDHLQPLRELSRTAVDAGQFLFTPQTSYLVRRSGRPSTANDAGENPPNGVVVYYSLKQDVPAGEKISLSFATQAGQEIASFTNQAGKEGKGAAEEGEEGPAGGKPKNLVAAKAGMNRFVWDMRYPEATRVPGAIIWAGSMQGPKIVPGTYKVTLTVGGHVLTRDFKVEKNPNNPATQADFEAQLALLQKIHGKLNQTNEAILRIREARDRFGQGGADKARVARLTEIENILMQTSSHANEDPLNYPIRLNNKLASLAANVGSDFGRPTRQDEEVYAELAAQVDRQLEALRSLLQ